MRRNILRALLVVPAFALAAPLVAQTSDPVEQSELAPIETRSEQVLALINGELEAPLEDVFTPEFLAAVPPSQLQAISGQLTGQFGRAVAVEKLDPALGVRSALEVRMERAIAKGGIAIDPSQGNRISELLFQTFEPVDDSAEKISADLEALPGQANALLAKLSPDGGIAPVFAYNESTQLALGSAFKLYVLSALAESVKQGTHEWGEAIPLTEKSFPSGQMQDWPQGTPVTLQTLAIMMISISDNTATDQLIAELGREAVEAELVASGNASPSRTVPLLTTRQLFALRGVSDDFIERYRAADDAGQAAILAAMTEADVSMEQVQTTFSSETPGAIDIEWFASPLDLAGLLRRIASREDPTAREVMAVQPRLAENLRGGLQYIGFKGGSEPGVLNLTWLLQDDGGDFWILTTGWNNPDAKVETAVLETIAQRLLALPR